MSAKSDEELFRRGIEQFNAHAFFDAHETWEAIWLRAAEPDKTFLQGIIQVAAAFHHHLRGKPAGALSLLRAGLEKLRPFEESYRGIRVAKLRTSVETCARTLEARESLPPGKLPQIEPVKPSAGPSKK